MLSFPLKMQRRLATAKRSLIENTKAPKVRSPVIPLTRIKSPLPSSPPSDYAVIQGQRSESRASPDPGQFISMPDINLK